MKKIIILNIFIVLCLNPFAFAYMHDYQVEKQALDIFQNKTVLFNLNYNNDNISFLGSHQGEACLGLMNITGLSDMLLTEYANSQGMDIYTGKFFLRLPVTHTKLSMGFEQSKLKIVGEPFDLLNINSEADRYYFSMTQPLFHTDSESFELQIRYDSIDLDTYIFSNSNFSFAPYQYDGHLDHSILRISQLLKRYTKTATFSIHSTFSFGLDRYKKLHYQYNETNIDGRFFSWSGKVKYNKKLSFLDSHFIFRTDLQFSDEPLPDDPFKPVEHLSIGGIDSVRGYRRNIFSTDNGITASIELRLPVLKEQPGNDNKPMGNSIVYIAPFLDWGHGWNVGQKKSDIDYIYSIGLGLIWDISKANFIRIYWGEAMRKIERNTEYDLQDDGLHLNVNLCGVF